MFDLLLCDRVVAWEPVPHFRAILHSLLAINNVTHLVTVRDKVVADVDGLNMIISVRPCHSDLTVLVASTAQCICLA